MSKLESADPRAIADANLSGLCQFLSGFFALPVEGGRFEDMTDDTLAAIARIFDPARRLVRLATVNARSDLANAELELFNEMIGLIERASSSFATATATRRACGRAPAPT